MKTHPIKSCPNYLLKSALLFSRCTFLLLLVGSLMSCGDEDPEVPPVEFDEQNKEKIHVICDSPFPVEGILSRLVSDDPIEVKPDTLNIELYRRLILDTAKYVKHPHCFQMMLAQITAENDTTYTNILTSGVEGSVLESGGYFATSFSAIIGRFRTFTATFMMEEVEVNRASGFDSKELKFLTVGYGPDNPATNEPRWRIHTVLEIGSPYIAGLSPEGEKMGEGEYSTLVSTYTEAVQGSTVERTYYGIQIVGGDITMTNGSSEVFIPSLLSYYTF